MRVGLVCGTWGQNIGNAFFNLGGKKLLEMSGCDVHFIQDSPAYWTFYNERKGDRRNAHPLIEDLDFDLVVLQGPLFTPSFGSLWSDRLARLSRSGTQWAVLSGGFRKYSDQELRVASEVIARTPPLIIATRDHPTSDALASVGVRSFSGIDSAFFAPEAAPRVPLREAQQPYVTFAFDHFPEPTLRPDCNGPISIGTMKFRAESPRLAFAAARRGKVQAYLAAPFDRRRLPAEIAGLRVLRPEHRTSPHIPLKIYRHPNSLASDEPWTYLHAYANTRLTLSDRVHACIATLAYGNPAMLQNPTTRRSALFEQVGAGAIRAQPSNLDMGLLQERKRELVEAMHAGLGQA